MGIKHITPDTVATNDADEPASHMHMHMNPIHINAVRVFLISYASSQRGLAEWMCLHPCRYGLSSNVGCADVQQALQFLMSLHVSSCSVSLV